MAAADVLDDILGVVEHKLARLYTLRRLYLVDEHIRRRRHL